MKRLMLACAMILGLLSVPAASFAYAQSGTSPGQVVNDVCGPGQTNKGVAGCGDHKGLVTGTKFNLVKTIINTLLYAAGIVSLVFAMIGGVKYATSTGDARRIQSAKDTLLYAIIGLIVTLIAIPITGFIIGRVS